MYRGNGSFTPRPQFYLKRGISEFYGPDGEAYESPITGKLVRNRKRVQRTMFLHVEVMIRAGISPPSPEHKIVDHYPSRNTMNCTRLNLRWATILENRLNNDYRNGKHRAHVSEG